jgi:hypothetical protein
MSTAHRYVRVAVQTSTVAFPLAAALGLSQVAAASAGLILVSALSYPWIAAEALRDTATYTLKLFGIVGLLVLTAAVAASGLYLFRWASFSSSTILLMPVGAGLAVIGFHLTKKVVRVLVFKPKPEPPAPLPLPKPQPPIVLMPPAPLPVPKPAPPPPAPPPKPLPREPFLWGAREVLASLIDQYSFRIVGPPGRGKTALLRLAAKHMLSEVLDPRCHSTLICIDSKRELYAWIASQMPPERKTGVPLRLMCANDKRTCTLDYKYDFSSQANHGTFAWAMAPKNPNLTQPFFEDSFRAVVAEAAGAIQRKVGRWDVELLSQVIANPGYVKKLVSGDAYAKFVAELLSAKSKETAQNVQMEMTSKIRKWLMLGALLSHVPTQIPERVLSIERFLEKRGVLVLQSDDDFPEELNAFNAMVLMRICQILMKRQPEDVKNSKVYIVIDEFPSLGNIPGFVKAVRELRSRNVVFVITWQNWSDMVHNWKDEAESIEGCLQSFIIVGSASPGDAEHSQKVLGTIRGIEAERSSSETSGSNSSTTDGTSDTTGTSFSQTRVAGTSGGDWDRPYIPPPPTPYGGGGFTPTDTRSISKSHTKSRSKTQGESYSTTKGVTWKYFERPLWTATEVMRSPIPTREGGFHGIAYVAGDPEPHDFVYESEFLEQEGVFKKNEHIPDYIDWPEKYQLPEPLGTGHLEDLGLAETDPSDPDAYPSQADADRLRREAAARATADSPPPAQPVAAVSAVVPVEEPCDWDELDPPSDDDDPENHVEEILRDQGDPAEPTP